MPSVRTDGRSLLAIPLPQGIGRSLVAKVITLPITTLVGFAYTRVVIGAVGPDGYGAIATIGGLFLLLPFADLGVGAAIVNRVAASPSPAEDEETNRVILSATRVLLASALVVLVAAAVITYTSGWEGIIGLGRGDLGGQVDPAVLLVLAIFALSLPLGIGQRLLLGLDRNDLVIFLASLAPVGALVATVVFRAGGAPLYVFAAALALGNLVSTTALTVAAVRVGRFTPALWLSSLFRFRTAPGTSIFTTAGPMLIIMIGLPLALQSDRLIIAHRGSDADLSPYSIGLQLFTPLWAVAAAAGQPLWPKFARQRVLGEPNWSAYLSSLKLLGGVSVVLAFCLVLFGPLVGSIVSGGEIRTTTRLFAAFALLLVVQSVHLPGGMLLTEPRGLRFQAACVVAMLVVSLGLSWLLTPSLGVIGPVIGSSIAVLVCQLVPGIYAAHAWQPHTPIPLPIRVSGR